MANHGVSGAQGIGPYDALPPPGVDPHWRVPDESCDVASEFGLPVGYVDPSQYHGKTPEQDARIHVSRDSRI